MGSRKRKNRSGRNKAPKLQPGPRLHVKVVAASSDVGAAMALVKPALLYADRVTILSPVARMLNDVTALANVEDPLEQIKFILALVDQVPELAGDLDVPNELRELLPTLIRRPGLIRAAARASGDESAVDGLYKTLEEMAEGWKGFQPAIEKLHERFGSSELASAVSRRLVVVDDLSSTGPSSAMAGAVNAATSGSTEEITDQLMAGFIDGALEAMSDPRSLPLLDANASGLIRAFEKALGQDGDASGSSRSREIGAVATLAGYLPYFNDMPVDEIVDLRRELSAPLVRFRAAMARMSREIATGPLDDEFQAEIEQRWREDIEPALLEIRETLAEHGLLRQVASVASGDPRRLMLESGAVIAAALSPQPVVQGAVAAGLAAGLPAADVALRAARSRRVGRKNAERNEFYFLHRVAEHSARSRIA